MESSLKHHLQLTAAVLLILLIRICLLNILGFELYADEAQYWLWSKDPKFGYFSKPPFIAWILKISTFFCGNSEACLRIASPIAHSITAVFIYSIGMQLYDTKIGLNSAIFYLLLPGVCLSSNIISTDPFLLMFWAATMLFIILAFQKNNFKYWLLAGLFAGFGMLSKYSMIFICFSLLLFLISEKKLKHYLIYSRFWCAILVAFLIWLPNIIWNITNHMVSFGHVFGQAQGMEVKYLNYRGLLEFIGAQALIFGPLPFTFLFYKIAKDKSIWHAQTTKLLCFFSIPSLALIAAISLYSRAYGNWAVPSYIALSILFTHLCLNKYKNFKLFYFCLAFNLLLYTSFISYLYLLNKTDYVDINTNTDILKRVRGGKEIATQLSNLCIKYSSANVVSDDRKTIALLSYYSKNECKPLLKWNPQHQIDDHFDLTTDLSTQKNKDIIMISKYLNNIQSLNGYGMKISQLDSLIYKPYDGFIIKYYVYLIKGFRGY